MIHIKFPVADQQYFRHDNPARDKPAREQPPTNDRTIIASAPLPKIDDQQMMDRDGFDSAYDKVRADPRWQFTFQPPPEPDSWFKDWANWLIAHHISPPVLFLGIVAAIFIPLIVLAIKQWKQGARRLVEKRSVFRKLVDRLKTHLTRSPAVRAALPATPADLLAKADFLAAQGDYLPATQCLFEATILVAIPPAHPLPTALTNRELQALPWSEAVRNALGRIGDATEAALFASHPLDRPVFEDCRARYVALSGVASLRHKGCAA